MAVLVFYFTRKPTYSYSSETTLYTGIASGSSVEMDKSLSFFATNTAFDNLINVIKSRETQQEVAIRLLAQHLMLEHFDNKYISRQSYIRLRQITPAYVEKLIVKKKSEIVRVDKRPEINEQDSNNAGAKAGNEEVIHHTVRAKETLYSISRMYGVTVEQIVESNDQVKGGLKTDQILTINKNSPDFSSRVPGNEDTPETDTNIAVKNFSFSSLDSSASASLAPPSINKEAYEQTVLNLKAFMAGSDTNFVYKLLYFNHPHYSLNSISRIRVQRIGSSDLVKLNYDSDDPGICQQTLAILTDVCIRNYKGIKENRSDAVVKYFEYQVKQAAARLQVGENKLLKFNEDHNIINYYEQSKAVAIVKEDLDVDYNNMRIKLAGTQAAIKRIEEKLGNQQEIQRINTTIIDKRNQLGDVNTKIATIETIGRTDSTDNQSLVQLKVKAEKLKDEMRNAVSNLYNYDNTTEGLHISSLLNDWLKNIIIYEDTKAGLAVLGDRITEFQKQYSIYAPAGANIKRIEREINVSEQEFLELLHGLNMAKLKMQDAELSSSIKAVDPPFYPLSPNPTKRKLLIIVAALLGFILVLGTILAMEYFDETLKNPKRASKILKLIPVGIFPRVFLNTGSLNFPFIANRLLEIIVQHLALYPKDKPFGTGPRIIIIFSTLSNEGKTTMAGNIAVKLKNQGKKVLVLNYSGESLHEAEISQTGYSEMLPSINSTDHSERKHKFSFLNRLLGYKDNRVDFDSPFLDDPDSLLTGDEHVIYDVNAAFYSSENYKDLVRGNPSVAYSNPDYVLLEIPDIISYPYPAELIKSASLSLLVCRANHVWSEADKSALDCFMEFTENDPLFLLNGVDQQVVESVLGDLPKKRSLLRRFVKRLIRFQFFTGNQP